MISISRRFSQRYSYGVRHHPDHRCIRFLSPIWPIWLDTELESRLLNREQFLGIEFKMEMGDEVA